MIESESLGGEINALKITPESREYLEETARWGRIIGIIGYLISSLIVLFAIGTLLGFGTGEGEFLERAFLTGTVTFLLVIAILFLLPSYFIFSFSKKIKNGLSMSDTSLMSLGMKDLKLTFQFYGIFIILFVVMYIGLTMFALSLASNNTGSF